MSKCLRCGAGNEWIEPVQKEATKPKPAPKPQEPSDAMAFAAIAISQLERIHPKDPERSEALVKVERWIQKHKGGK